MLPVLFNCPKDARSVAMPESTAFSIVGEKRMGTLRSFRCCSNSCRAVSGSASSCTHEARKRGELDLTVRGSVRRALKVVDRKNVYAFERQELLRLGTRIVQRAPTGDQVTGCVRGSRVSSLKNIHRFAAGDPLRRLLGGDVSQMGVAGVSRAERNQTKGRSKTLPPRSWG